MTAAHEQQETLKLCFYFPAHEPRESDPHYPLFEAVRRKLKAAGRLVCWICDATEEIELHHAEVEFALAAGVDVVRFAIQRPEFNLTDEESFLCFVESEGNLLPLCVDHHRGLHGVHSLPYPCWVVQRCWKTGLPCPGEVERGTERV